MKAAEAVSISACELERRTVEGVQDPLRAGVHPKIASTWLGHATVAFTLDTYTADIPELDQAAAVTISNLFLPRRDEAPGAVFTDPLTEQPPS